jgi:hypothetical protein
MRNMTQIMQKVTPYYAARDRTAANKKVVKIGVIIAN